MTDNDRIRFEKYMVNVEKIIVGSSDPYPQGLEKRYWKVWCAALETPPKPTWTKADQEKGVLPTVGCELRIGSDLYIVEAINSNEGQLCVRDKRDGELSITYRQYIEPIETPREKYDRERDECIDKLLAKIPPSPITVVPAMKIVYEEIRPFTGDDHD